MPTPLTLACGGLTFSARACGEGSLVLCLHGFPDTEATFDDTLPALAAAGYCAVSVRSRGYEPSSQPGDSDYHGVRMAEDVVAWADALGAGRFHLVGHDWGASIAYAVAGLAVERLASLTVLAVPHPLRFAEVYAADAAQQARSAYIVDFLVPDAAALVAADDFAYLEALWRRWSPGWAIPPSALAAMRDAFGQPGVLDAALGYYRQAFDVASPAGVATAALFATPVTVPTLGLIGEDDGCVAADVFTAAMRSDDFPGGLRVERIAAAGHFLHCEQPDPVNRLIVEWLDIHPI